MKFRFRPFYLAVLFFASLVSGQAHALVSSEVTLSSGYYQDYEANHQIPVFLYWTLNYTEKNGLEAYFDLGFNNQLLIDQWGFFLYQAYVTVPFSPGFAQAPYRRSRIQLGRQFLSDGFELTLLDGARVPIYWSADGGAELIAGGSYAVGEKRYDFSSQIYGGTLHQRFLGATWKAGFFQKKSDLNGSEGLAHASLFKSFDTAFLKPAFLLKGQWRVSGSINPDESRGFSEINQGYGELLLSPTDTLSVGSSYSKRQPSGTDPLETSFVYRLVAISPQETLSAFANWSAAEDLQLSGNVRQIQFNSQAGEETAQEQELGVSWLTGKSSWRPSLFHLKSYGGTVWQPAIAYRRSVSDTTGLRAEFAAARLEKINGIETWAYHTRTGMDLRLAPRLLTLALLEAESNHRFELDARVVAFLTYYLF